MNIGDKCENGSLYFGEIKLPRMWAIELPIMKMFCGPTLLFDENGVCARTGLETLQEVFKLKSWNGFDGVDLQGSSLLYRGRGEYRRALYEHFKECVALGIQKTGWFVPPREMLDGRTTFSEGERQPNNLYAHIIKNRNLADLFNEYNKIKRSVETATASIGAQHTSLWSCDTQLGYPDWLGALDMQDGSFHHSNIRRFKTYFIPVRVEFVLE